MATIASRPSATGSRVIRLIDGATVRRHPGVSRSPDIEANTADVHRAGRLGVSMSVRDFDQVLMTTRAVRKRLDLERPVEPAVITECIELAAQAPIGSNIHSWRFLVVTDPDLRAAIGEYYRRGASEYLAAGRALARTPAQIRVSDSSTYLMENFGRVPVHVLALMKGRPPSGDQALAGYY